MALLSETQWAVVFSVLLLFVVKKVLEYVKAVRSIHNHPGFRVLMSPNGVASLWPSIPFVSVGNNIQTNGFKFYEQYGVDIISCVSVFPTTAINYFIADPVVTKEIMTQRLKFPKPIELYELLLFFGRNIVASERDEWKKYRKISAPAFTEPNNKLVWDETVRVVQDLFDNIWGDQKEVVSENALEITMPLALFIIGAAGFGRRLSWTDEAVPDPGHKLTFRETLYTVSTDVILKVSLPKLALYATERTRKVKLAFEELEHYMLDMIKHRRNATKKEDRYDLFSSLLDANEGLLDGEAKLTDQELLGNIFIFLIAGHETTAHTLAFALALLALHQDEQEALYQDLKKNFPDGRIPTYDDISKLGHVEAVMNETLRLFPPAPSVPKYATEDTTFVTKNAAGEKVVVPVPAGTGISLNISALQKNPRYWPNPDKFDPGRFLSNDWPRDAFVPFSGGVRSCLGRRFAELESLVVLSMFFLKYKITVKEEPQYANETWEEKRARVLKVTQGITITPVRVPLLFTRRD